MKISRHLIASTLLAVSTLIPSNFVKAQNVDIKKAKETGAYFIASQLGNKSVTPETIKLVYDIPNTNLDIPALYVFNANDNNGFVIVAGSECVDPIIAYSTDGAFDPNNIPPNMQWWLNEQAVPIVFAQNNSLVPVAEVKAQWTQLEEKSLPYFGSSSKDAFFLLTSKWDQAPLYNNWCPMLNNHRCVTGCVATAIAQIIYFWKFPRVGKQAKSYTWNGQTLSVNYSQEYYDYDNMVDELTSSSTQEQIDAVAKLSYHCGVAVEMRYTDSTSSASNSEVKRAMRMYFKYVTDSLKYVQRTDAQYNNPNSTTAPDSRDTAWVDMLRTEILKHRPIYYSGYDLSNSGRHSGHAFVCDGYNSQTKTFHFNWGWGGSSNCWCNVYTSKLKPLRMSYNYSSNHSALIGIQPPNDSIQSNPVFIDDVDNPFTGAIYPNPASSQVTISYRLADDHNTTLQIFDATGRKVKETVITPASTQITIPVENFNPGLYICRINGHTSKFIVK